MSSRQNATRVRDGRGRGRRHGGLLHLVVVEDQEAEAPAADQVAEGRRAERSDGVPGQVARCRSRHDDGVHAAGPEVRLAERSDVDGHRSRRAIRHRQADAKNGPGEELS